MYSYTRLKVPTFIYHHLQGNPNSSNLQFEVAISGRPLPEQTDFGSMVAAHQTDLCPSQLHNGLHHRMFSDNDSLFLVASITRCYLLLIYLPHRDERL